MEIFFIQENAFENVVRKLAAILSRPQFARILSPEQYGLHFKINLLHGNCSYSDSDLIAVCSYRRN